MQAACAGGARGVAGAGRRRKAVAAAQALGALGVALVHGAGVAGAPAPQSSAVTCAAGCVEDAAVRARVRLARRAVVGCAPRRLASARARRAVPHAAVRAVLRRAHRAGWPSPRARALARALRRRNDRKRAAVLAYGGRAGTGSDGARECARGRRQALPRQKTLLRNAARCGFSCRCQQGLPKRLPCLNYVAAGRAAAG
jgi:hypothetical protein